MAMRIRRYIPSASPSIAGLGLPEIPLDAAAIGRVFAPYRPGGGGCIDKNIRKNISPKLNFEVWRL